MKKLRNVLLSVLAVATAMCLQAQTLFTCGDSTMADYATDGSTPTRGWGQYFGSFFDDDITVVNYGKGGQDVQGFYNAAAYWQKIKTILKPGDYVLLQFAHNDEKNGGMDGYQLRDYYLGIGDQTAAAAVDLRGSIPHDTYVKTLRKLVGEIRERGGIPLFASSICRMNFTADGDIRRAARHDLGDSFSKLTPEGPTTGNSVPADDHSMDFRWQMEQLGAELDVPFVDLTQATRELFVQYGQTKTSQILSDGQGGTHLSVAGAALIARRCAEMMAEQGILADHINVSDAGISLSPADGNLGAAYAGNILSREYTITGFGLSPEKGEVTVSADGIFEVSADKARWSKSVAVAYDGGTLIGTVYVRASLSEPGTYTGTLKASASNSEASLDLTAEASAIPGSGAVSLQWPLLSDTAYTLDGEAEVVSMRMEGLKAVGCDGGIRLLPLNGVWPDGDIDESPSRYVEFGIRPASGKLLEISRIAMQIGAFGSDLLRCHANWSVEDGFGSPHTFYSPVTMAAGVMNEASTDLKLNLAPGQTLLVRVYPWAESTCTAPLCIAGVSISGYTSNESTAVTLSWPLDAGTSNPAAADVESNAFAFTGYSVGSDLTVTGTSKPADRTGTMYQPKISNQNTYTDPASVVFTLRPRHGITFRPSKVSFWGTKNGTGGGLFNAVLDVDGVRTELASDLSPERNNTGDRQTRFDLPVDGVVVYDNTLTLYLGIRSLADNKTVTIHDVVIEGEVSGTEIAVPAYSISVSLSDPDAGTVTMSPNTATVDENVNVTVSATENFGYRFTGWTADGKTVSTDNPYTFPATADVNLVAQYEKLSVFPLSLKVSGGANPYMVTVAPEGHDIDGVRYYEAGTEVMLSASGNRILTFTNWEDNSTAASRELKMDEAKDIEAAYSAADYIVGWDFTIDEPASQRAADFKAETDNAGLLSLHNENGETSSWLSRGTSRGDENGRYAARVWKVRTSKLFYEISFSSKGYTNLAVASALSCTYNTYSRFFVQCSTDGKNYTTLGEMAPGNRTWTEAEFTLPAEAADCERVYVRWYPDWDAPLIGNETDYDGLAISDIFVMAEPLGGNDETAPVLTTTIPAPDAIGASVSGSVVLTFDEKVVPGKGNATLGGKVLVPTVAGKSIVYPYTGLEYNTTYTFELPEGAVTDRSGNKAAAVRLSFTTMERVQPEARLYDAVVDINGTADYTSVQAAIDAAPEGRVKPWLIFVMNGNYKEHVDIPASKSFMHIIGQDRDKTVILDDRLSGGDNAVHVREGATVMVNADDCFFENITLENSYGHEKQTGPQALALNSAGDRIILNNVALLSYQDTWITTSKSANRAYMKNSLVEGAVDFIYNSGDLYCENTTLLITRDSGGFIVAPSHGTDVKWGYVFRDCTITAPGDPSRTTVWLGRPWHNFPRTVFLNTTMEVNIPATGWYETMGGLPVVWAEWNSHDADGNLLDLSQRRDTYYYTDSDGQRVYGTAKNRLTDEEAAEYTLANVLSGSDNWQPAVKTEACAAPVAALDGNVISWEAVPYAICYVVTSGDKVVDITTDTSLAVDSSASEWQVRAVNEFGGLSAPGEVKDDSGVAGICADDYEVEAYYDIHGRRLTRPVQGVNIVMLRNSAGDIRVEKTVR